MGIIYCRCSACGAGLKVDLELVAPEPICPRCSAPLVIPSASSEEKPPVAKPLDDAPSGGSGQPGESREQAAGREDQPARAEDAEEGFPHIVTDSPGSGEGPRHSSAAVATRGRTSDRALRLGILISAACAVLLIVVVGVFPWLSSQDGSAAKAPARRPTPPPSEPAPVPPASPEPSRSTLVLDWPQGERLDSMVYIDGSEQPLPTSGDAKFAVRPGEHTVLIERRGYEPIEIRMTFEEGGHHHYRPEWKQVALARLDPGQSAPVEPPPGKRAAEGRYRHDPRKEKRKEQERRPEKPSAKPQEPPPKQETPTPKLEQPAGKPAPEPAKPAPEPTSPSDFDSPEEFLASRGLRRLSSVFALSEESEVSGRLREAESLRKKAFDAEQKVMQAQKVVDDKKRLMLTYVQQSRELGAKLPFARNVEQHNQIVTALNELDSRILILRESKQEEQALDQARAAATTLREQFVEHLLELRRFYDEVGERYEALAADAAVRQAVGKYGQSSEKTYRLGPSTLFAGMENKLARLEKMVLSEAIPLRRGEGNLWYVTAVFNGQKTQEMAIDTGASIIALSWEVANKVGLTPGEKDPGMLVEVADGRVVEAKQVVAETVRVGKFTAKNVQCAVMPGGLPRTTPLLGLSFFKNFSFKIDSGNGQLIMSQLETADAE